MKKVETLFQGMVTYWKLAEASDLKSLEPYWHHEGLEKYLPSPHSPEAAVHAALTKLCGQKRKLIRPLAKRGCALVSEKANGDDLDYEIQLIVKAESGLNGSAMADTLNFQPYDHALRQEITDEYHRQRLLVPRVNLAAALTKVATKEFKAVCLREAGGVYWIPMQFIDGWTRAANAAEQAAVEGTSSVYMLNTVFDDLAVFAIVSALTQNVESQVAMIRTELTEKGLGKRAKNTKAREAADLSDKIKYYEGMLGIHLDKLHRAVEEVETEAGFAGLASLA